MENGELEAKLRYAPIGFAVLEGPGMVYTAANRRYLDMVARTADIVGRRWAEVFPELVGSPTEEAVRAASAGHPVHVQELLVPLVRDGVLRDGFYSFSLDPTHRADGTVDGFVVLAVDVTELVVRRREADALAAELRAREARYQAIFAEMDEGYCIIEMLYDATGTPIDYRFVEANAAFVDNTGLVNAIGKTVKELVPQHEPHWFQLYGDVARTGEPARFEQGAAALGRWYDCFATRVGDPDNHLVGVLFKDVSARRRLDLDREELLRAEQDARLRAEEANRLKDEFLATVSHELRTPLNAILGYTTLLRTSAPPPDQGARWLATIERNARAQAQLIEDLLDISRMLAGKVRLDVQPIELHDVVEAAVDTVRPAAEARNVRLQTALGTGGLVMGDAHRLQQVVWNLLSNAVKFTPKGGRIQATIELHESSVEVVIADTGIGIAPEFVPHVFERFRQADGGTTRLHGGLGLGLSIVRQLVELHGGTVGVASAGKDQGTTFTVRLPLAIIKRTGATPPPHARGPLAENGYECPPELEGLDILAVDDEIDSADMLRSLLESCGALVRVAHSVEEALREMERQVPSVLLSDIGMPDADGFSLIARVRALPPEAGGNVPAAALTACARTEDRTRCLRAGFDSHVPKPIEPFELLAVIASLATRRNSRIPGMG